MYIKLLALNVVFRQKTNNQNTNTKKKSKNKINKTNTKQPYKHYILYFLNRMPHLLFQFLYTGLWQQFEGDVTQSIITM